MIQYSKDVQNKMKQDEKDRQQSIRNIKLLSKRQSNAENGILEPIQDTRTFEEQQEDEVYQKNQLINHTRQLLRQPVESTKLANLIHDNGMMPYFNAYFTSIYERLRTAPQSARIMFNKIKNFSRIDVDDSYDNRRLTVGDYKESLRSLISLVRDIVEQNGMDITTKLEDYMEKMEALSQVSEYNDETADIIQENSITKDELDNLNYNIANVRDGDIQAAEDLLAESNIANITKQMLTDSIQQSQQSQQEEENEQSQEIINSRNRAKAKYANDKGDFEAVMINWSQYTQPDMIQLINDVMANNYMTNEDSEGYDKRIFNKEGRLKSNLSKEAVKAYISTRIDAWEHYINPTKQGLGMDKRRKQSKRK